MKRVILLWICVLLMDASALAQEVPERVRQQLEEVAEALEADPEDDQWLQQVEQYRKHPLNLNTASEEDLRTLRLLTDLQIFNLVHYRQQLGRLVSVYELQAVPGWEALLIQRLLPYITVEDNVVVAETFKQRFKEGQHLFLLSDARVLEAQKGYSSGAASRYLGSKDRVQFRYQYRYQNVLQFGLTGDKDAGEPFFRGAQKQGFDFYSGHLFVRKVGIVKALALGDYTVNMGQGLIHWQSLAFGKGAEAINIKRQSAVLQPYSSAGEFYFNRGAGATLQKGRVELTAFASYRKLSGNRVVDTLSGQEFVSSLQTSGYHRTPSELEDRNHVGLTAYGGNLALKYSRLRVGVNAVRNHLSKSLQKNAEPYNLYAIGGKNWSNYSLDYSATVHNVHLFGEGAVDQRFRKALVQGLLASVHPRADVSLLYRNIAAGYQSFSGRAFTENATPTNEEGFYMGLSLRPHPFYKVDAYADFYRFPWLKYRVDAPSAGRDYSLQVSYAPSKTLELYARYRNEQKGRNTPGRDSVSNALQLQRRHNWRLHLDYQRSSRWELRARAEGVFFHPGGGQGEQGFSAYAEGIYRQGTVLSGNLRLHYFATDSYNSRIYAYESDLLFHYTIPAFFNQGLRYYIRLNWDAGKRVSCWLRWAQTLYMHEESIGSGLEEIDGDQRSELRFQVRLTI